MSGQPSRYISFLLRLWRDDDTSPWRVQLEDPHTGERRGFSSVEKMMAFIDSQLVPQPAPSHLENNKVITQAKIENSEKKG